MFVVPMFVVSDVCRSDVCRCIEKDLISIEVLTGIFVDVYENALISILKFPSSPPLGIRCSVPFYNVQVYKTYKF